MAFDRPLSCVGRIDTTQRLEWTKPAEETEEGEARIWMDMGHLPRTEDKMSHYSQHWRSKDLDNMKAIIMVID